MTNAKVNMSTEEKIEMIREEFGQIVADWNQAIEDKKLMKEAARCRLISLYNRAINGEIKDEEASLSNYYFNLDKAIQNMQWIVEDAEEADSRKANGYMMMTDCKVIDC